MKFTEKLYRNMTHLQSHKPVDINISILEALPGIETQHLYQTLASVMQQEDGAAPIYPLPKEVEQNFTIVANAAKGKCKAMGASPVFSLSWVHIKSFLEKWGRGLVPSSQVNAVIAGLVNRKVCCVEVFLTEGIDDGEETSTELLAEEGYDTPRIMAGLDEVVSPESGEVIPNPYLSYYYRF